MGEADNLEQMFVHFTENETRTLLMLQANSTTDWYGGPRASLMFESVLTFVYASIFVVGLLGNLLVGYVVVRNRHMRTVTNYFITNLGLADIMLCTLAGPITAAEYLVSDWVFGEALCHLIPFALGVSVYLSVFTLMMIACDRYAVILYPFRPRMETKTCLLFIGGSWIVSILLTLPYGINMALESHAELGDRSYCFEAWSEELYRKWFTSATFIVQFIVPFIVTSFCYTCVWIRLADRSKNKPGTKSVMKEELDRKRKRRTTLMLITMVLIFGASWLPFNMHHIMVDFNRDYADWQHSDTLFFITHAFAMSSACYNPFLYAWLNENFRKEFKLVLPCFFSKSLSVRTSVRNTNGVSELPEPAMLNGSERTCQKPLLAAPQITDLIEVKVARPETSYFTTNLISTCEV